MKKKKIAASAAAGTLAILAICGIFAAKTVFAAEERISITESDKGTAIQSNTDNEALKVYKKEIYNDEGCTVLLPEGYVSSESIKGLYISERRPVDSSNIYYSVSEGTDVEALRESLNSGYNKSELGKKFKEAYGANAVIRSYQTEELKVNGCPAFKIKLSCELDDMTMEQLIYIIAADQTYTITYSQAADDGRMEEFEKSAQTIRMVFQEDNQ